MAIAAGETGSPSPYARFYGHFHRRPREGRTGGRTNRGARVAGCGVVPAVPQSNASIYVATDLHFVVDWDEATKVVWIYERPLSESLRHLHVFLHIVSTAD